MDSTLEEIDGMGATTAKQLRQSGICTVSTLAYQDPDYLADDIDISKHKTRVLIRNAREMIPHTHLRAAIQVETELKDQPRLSTGINELDGLLHGGFPRGSFICIHGRSQSGKTHWCHQLAVTSQLPPEDGGLGGQVIYIDLEGGFYPDILRIDAKRFGLDEEAVLSNIRCWSIRTQEDLDDCIDLLPKLLWRDTGIVLIDSLRTLPSDAVDPDYPFPQNARQNKIGRILYTFNRLARATDTIFLLGNLIPPPMLCDTTLFRGLSHTALLGVKSHYIFQVHIPDSRQQPTLRTLRLQNAGTIPMFTYPLTIDWGGFYARDSTGGSEALTAYANNLMGKSWSREI